MVYGRKSSSRMEVPFMVPWDKDRSIWWQGAFHLTRRMIGKRCMYCTGCNGFETIQTKKESCCVVTQNANNASGEGVPLHDFETM